MKIEILAVGSELLSPFFQDTNSLFLTRRLNDLGLDVSLKTIVGDDHDDLLNSIRDALPRAGLLLIMGGLGPTSDDITREVCAEALGKKLLFDQDLGQGIEAHFRRRGKDMPSSNRKQAFIIEGAVVLENKNGTAPGQWIVHGGTRIALLPGPPHELLPMFEECIWPKLEGLGQGVTARRTLRITGMTESEVENHISDLYPKTPELRLTILSSPGQIELHLTAFSKTPGDVAATGVESLTLEIRRRLGDFIFSSTGEDLEAVVGGLLRERQKTLATAESCTGGLLAGRITDVSGSSEYFLEGFITYANAAKNARLGVPLDMIAAHGAVSREVAEAMAAGVRQKTGADFGLAVTGIAGPSGGTPEKPLGLVYAALSREDGVDVQKNVFLGKRNQVRFQATQKALDMLRRVLIDTRPK
ncbi:MAG: competence/damage-inducible protein A [Candidatus Aminicenantales bacterium]